MLTLDEMKEMLASGTYLQVMSKLLLYAKNILGTNGYWYQQKNNLKALLNQMGPPTIFWTLSCAELHWPEYHALFTESNMMELKSSDFRRNVIKHPHFFEWFFVQRTEAFVKITVLELHGIGTDMSMQFYVILFMSMV